MYNNLSKRMRASILRAAILSARNYIENLLEILDAPCDRDMTPQFCDAKRSAATLDGIVHDISLATHDRVKQRLKASVRRANGKLAFLSSLSEREVGELTTAKYISDALLIKRQEPMK